MLLGQLGCGASPNHRALSLTILWASVVWLVGFFGRAMRLETSTESRATRASVSRGMPGLLSRQRSMACSKGLPHARSGAFPRLIVSLTVMETHPGAGNL